ncbi:MAG: L-threonylcarbamoyladenylate synthase [Desulfobulbaceae bacterium]|nr:L-threonylcarbamoyladenylate synthase [Desulfobulbaceae bacterium]
MPRPLWLSLWGDASGGELQMMISASLPDVSDHDLAVAVRVIKEGGVVAFPTETYYGLAVDSFNSKALARLFEIKQRPLSKAVLVLVQDQKQLPQLVEQVPAVFVPLLDQFWPGPLTLVFPAQDRVSPLLTGGTGTVGVRVSSHPVAARLLFSAGIPLTATSANISGQEPATSAAQVKTQFGDAVDCIIDGGETPGGKGSTLIGCGADGRCLLLRDGVVPFSSIEAVIGVNLPLK